MMDRETIAFSDEIARREAAAEEALDTLEDLDPDNPEFDDLLARAEQTDDDIRLLEWMRDEAHSDNGVDVWDEQTDSITLGGLTAGEMAHVRSELPDGATTADAEAFIVAKATVDAPYHDPDADLDEQMVAVAHLPAEVVSYLERQATELMQVGEGNSERSERLRAARERKASTGD